MTVLEYVRKHQMEISTFLIMDLESNAILGTVKNGNVDWSIKDYTVINTELHPYKEHAMILYV